ncbi:MAG TPA: hypothetical protein VLK88_12055 [Gemmatimonadales bacterium]|nr:hypothetical protein [Gemmatimonadales bacterium]
MDIHVYELMRSLIVVGGVIAAVLLLGPVGRALARRLERRSANEPEVLPELEALRGRVEQQSQQILELEERLDFSERMLSQRRDSAALTEGGK